MGKKEKIFYIGTIKPEKVYETLISLLKDTPADPYLNKRLGMIITSHSILSENPFRAEVKVRTTFSFTGFTITYITCTIVSEGIKTRLTINSSMPEKLWDGRVHDRSIKRLYGELRYRLEVKDKPSVDETLRPTERVIEDLSPIEFEGIELSAIITNARILLSREKIVIREIDPIEIENLTLEKEKSRMPIYLAYSGMFIIIPFLVISIFLFIINPVSGSYNHALSFFRVSLPFILIGGGMVGLGIILSYQYFLVIQESVESINIYGKKKTLNHLEEMCYYLKRQSPHLRHSLDKPDQADEEGPPPTQFTVEAKSCPLCGAKNRLTEDFCKECGASL